MNLCVCDNEGRECGVGSGVDDTVMFRSLQVVGISETVRTVIRLRQIPMNLW
jgi:hypothetical protein